MQSRIAAVFAVACAAVVPAALHAQSMEPYKDTALPFDVRVKDLVERMTLEEKAQQIQMAVEPNGRLGLEGINWWSEAIHGVSRAGSATVFPQAVAMSATWNPEMLRLMGEVTSDEARAKYTPRTKYQGLTLWAPTINMARDPRWGRNEETYGEDPYLAGRLAVSFVKGLQGTDSKYFKTIATPKHFAMHSQEEGRVAKSFDCPEEVLRDYYLPAFEAAFREGGAMSTMAAHNGINKIPAHANFWLLTDVLRREWGFQGAVVTDWMGIQYLVNNHRYANSVSEACAAAINAGVDVLSDQRNLAPEVVAAVQAGELKVDVLNRAVTRNLTVRMRLGMFDPPNVVPFARTPRTEIGSPEHMQAALQSAKESFVLLKNGKPPEGFGFDKLLPIDRRVRSIAVVGPYANVRQFGAYSGTPANPSPTIVEAINNAVGLRMRVNTADYNNGHAASYRVAEESEVVIAVMGLNMQVEKEGIDRSSVLLPPDQQAFLEGLIKKNPLTIVLLEGGSPLGLAWMKENVPAIMMIWYPGEQGGNAVAQTLFGQSNPSGRLPMTFYRANDDLPNKEDYDIRNGRTYMYLEKAPSFVFGHGLSYTTFAYKNLRVEKSVLPASTRPAPMLGATPPGPAVSVTSGPMISVTVDVANTGEVDGDEVVQLYVRVKDPKVKRPMKQLKGFQRVTIAKGQTKAVTLTVPVGSLGFWSVAQKKYVVDAGAYEMMVGASSEDIRAKADVVVE